MKNLFPKNRIPIHVAVLALVGGLVWWTLRQVSFAEMWRTLAGIRLPMLALLLAVNGVVVWLFSSRWWVILRALKYRLPYRHPVAYRLTAFGISYFTPGTQFGGEPAQVYFLSQRDGIPVGDAIFSVAVDKLFELTFNFAFLGLGGFVVLRTGLVAAQPLPATAIAFVPATLPLLALAVLCSGKYPRTAALHRWVQLPFLRKIAPVLTEASANGAKLCRNSPKQMLLAAMLSAAIWLGLAAEYWLMVRALGLSLSLTETVVLLTAARLAFLFPTPGGLGALEAGQVIAMEALGFDPALGLSLSLLIRARDILFGVAGLWLGKILYNKKPAHPK